MHYRDHLVKIKSFFQPQIIKQISESLYVFFVGFWVFLLFFLFFKVSLNILGRCLERIKTPVEKTKQTLIYLHY